MLLNYATKLEYIIKIKYFKLDYCRLAPASALGSKIINKSDTFILFILYCGFATVTEAPPDCEYDGSLGACVVIVILTLQLYTLVKEFL